MWCFTRKQISGRCGNFARKTAVLSRFQLVLAYFVGSGGLQRQDLGGGRGLSAHIWRCLSTPDKLCAAHQPQSWSPHRWRLTSSKDVSEVARPASPASGQLASMVSTCTIVEVTPWWVWHLLKRSVVHGTARIACGMWCRPQLLATRWSAHARGGAPGDSALREQREPRRTGGPAGWRWSAHAADHSASQQLFSGASLTMQAS
jgi:hypothetical protein